MLTEEVIEAKDLPYAEAPCIGSGYTGKKLIPSRVPEDTEEKSDSTPVASGPDVWGPEPSVVGQMVNHPTTFRLKPMQVKVFNLSKEEDAKAYSEVWAKFTDMKSPRCRISEMDRQFYEGAYHVYLMYQDIEYKQLIQKK